MQIQHVQIVESLPRCHLWVWLSTQHDFQMAVQAILDTIKHKLSRLSIGTCDEAPNEELPETIRAHATITTMLSLVKRTRMAFSTTNVKFTDKRRRQELKVLNALATVLDRDVEVVAVVGKSDDGSGELKVIVSAHLVRDMERRPTAQPGSFGGRILNLFSNGNPRRSGPMGSLLSTSDPPAIVNPCAPRLNSMISGGWSNRSIAAGECSSMISYRRLPPRIQSGSVI